MLLENNLTFQKAVDKALSLEASYRDNLEIKNGFTSDTADKDINKVSYSRSRDRYRTSSPRQSRNHSSSKRRSSSAYSRNSYRRNDNVHTKCRSRVDFHELGIADRCIKCGKNNHSTDSCRTICSKLKCSTCNKRGHVSIVCISTLMRQLKNSKFNHIFNEELPSDVTDFNSESDCNFLSEVDALSASVNLTDRLMNSERYHAEVIIPK